MISNSKYVDSEGNKYKYKLELSGIIPGTKEETTLIILTDDNTLTFNDVAKYVYTNNRDLSNINFSILSTE